MSVEFRMGIIVAVIVCNNVLKWTHWPLPFPLTVLGQHPLLVCDYWTDPRAGKKVYDEVQANLASAPGPGQALGLMIIKWCSVLSPHLIWGHTVSCVTNPRPVSRSRDLSGPIRSQYPGHVTCSVSPGLRMASSRMRMMMWTLRDKSSDHTQPHLSLASIILF